MGRMSHVDPVPGSPGSLRGESTIRSLDSAESQIYSELSSDYLNRYDDEDVRERTAAAPGRRGAGRPSDANPLLSAGEDNAAARARSAPTADGAAGGKKEGGKKQGVDRRGEGRGEGEEGRTMSVP